MAQTTIGWTATPILQPDGSIKWYPGWTFNTHWGCFKVSPGCQFCYADTLSTFYGYPNIWGPPSTTSRRLFGEKHWQEPLAWNRKAEKLGQRLKVFCASMADVFEDHPDVEPERAKLWPLIEQTPWLNWLLLTKRPESIMQMVPLSWYHQFPENVWVGTSVENQEYAEKRIPFLTSIPAVVHFLSCEPLLFPLDLTPWLPSLEWIITGGESGDKHRAIDPSWVCSIQGQCAEHHVPFFHKQWGGLRHNSGGRILYGRTWDQMPKGVSMSPSTKGTYTYDQHSSQSINHL